MPEPPRQMHLGMFLQGAGHHVAGWRYPGAESGSENLPHLVRQAVTAERAKFDMVFLADGLTSSEDGHPSQIARFEPLMVLAAFAIATSRIGLAATASTTYGEPFHLARAFASLDHLSHGRAAWNAVTTSYASTGANFGDQASRARRPLRHRRGVHRRGAAACGIRGRTARFPRTRRPASMRISRSATCSTTRASTSRSKVRSTPRARRRAIRSSCSPARRSPASSSRRAPPTWCSPRTRASKARRRSIAS